MRSIIAYPNNREQEKLLESLLKEMKIHFEIEDQDEDTLFTEQEFYAKIDKSIHQADTGQTRRLTKERQKDLFWHGPRKIDVPLIYSFRKTSA